MAKSYVDNTGRMLAQIGREEQSRLEKIRTRALIQQISETFPLFSPNSALEKAFSQAFFPDKKIVLRVPDTETIPSFVYKDMYNFILGYFISLNGLKNDPLNPNMARKAGLLKDGFAKVDRHLLGLVDSSGRDAIGGIVAFANRHEDENTHDATYLNNDPSLLELSQVKQQGCLPNLHYVENGDGEQNKNGVVCLRTENLSIAITGSRLEAEAHNLSIKYKIKPENIQTWSQLPDGLRTFLVNLDSYSALIYILRFMGFRQVQLIGNDQRRITGLLDSEEIRIKFGRYDQKKVVAISEFVTKIYDYDNQKLWNVTETKSARPVIGWKSMVGLATKEILELANKLDGKELLIPDKHDSNIPDWLEPVEYQRQATYQVRYQTLLEYMVKHPKDWADALSDQRWLKMVLNSSWTDQITDQYLDLFPLFGQQN